MRRPPLIVALAALAAGLLSSAVVAQGPRAAPMPRTPRAEVCRDRDCTDALTRTIAGRDVRVVEARGRRPYHHMSADYYLVVDGARALHLGFDGDSCGFDSLQRMDFSALALTAVDVDSDGHDEAVVRAHGPQHDEVTICALRGEPRCAGPHRLLYGAHLAFPGGGMVELGRRRLRVSLR